MCEAKESGAHLVEVKMVDMDIAHTIPQREGGGTTSGNIDRRMRRGEGGENSPHGDPNSRKRRPRQMWVPKGEGDKQEGDESFIRDTRQKTSSVFDCIKEQGDLSAPPARE